ncbi:MAG: hypothetical protein Q8K37_08560, partial [Alphaproteobacteria bacterium]|nr:hypothetical protein [Alphaproteobacteria bacterium]
MNNFIGVLYFIGVFFTSNVLYAFDEIFVTNNEISENGLKIKSIEDWLSKKNIEQDDNGEEYFDFLDTRLYLDPNERSDRLINPNCVQLRNPSDSERDLKITLISINQQCLNPIASNEWKLAYVIKDLEDNDIEVDNLKIVQSNHKVQWLLNNPTNFPKPLFSLPFSFNYYDSNDKDRYFIILNAAQGKSFHDIITNESMDNIAKAYEKLGQAFGNMHVKFMDQSTLLSKDSLPSDIVENNPITRNEKKLTDYYKTITHGDAHGGNIYFDFTKNQVETIDNDSYASKRTDSNPIDADLFSIFITFFDAMNETELCTTTISNVCTNANIAMQSFFKNNFLAYPETERAAIRIYIELFLKNMSTSSIARIQERENIPYFTPFILFSMDTAIQIPVIIEQSKK